MANTPICNPQICRVLLGTVGYCGVLWGTVGCCGVLWRYCGDQLISIKLAFLYMKIVQDYTENMLRSASESTYIFLLKIKNSAWFLYPLPPVHPSKAQYYAVYCSTLYPEAL